ncbi:ureidoglycolate lyase [Clostridium luticellarii]|jgi:ureidoglycolate lyase|uniref:Ureidoglycolate hydrolase n=1 Tax=Clostridium luticellarii TaxID=1691940 RepID=A0A2T0BPM9_9CLOT|nr:ureidoglycolate lyase [Clostridium luticellarii]MCI1944216.1 ureidoglycolate lyase [Clostridium luticellarii]MCI1967718.1 ureidoglycolate lyase [Clostridium luticellarii]MCI1994833.1 ureidoglycolate lyase [Clostridium luticellarii]MCI2039682.1 ureidoglycolate lyase [Clostridium luticellarii]PRR85829.1 ureidoglycolate hydrolase [Clostridium luticellarii]
MRKIKAKKITLESFKEFGEFYSYLRPTGNNFGIFYPDTIKYPVSGNIPVAFSAMVNEKPEKYIVSAVEYHNYTCEIILPLDDDIIVHVAPCAKNIVPEKTEAFIVPKGTAVKINTGVWHKAPMPVHNDRVHMLIVLPERTYMNDINVVEYKEEDKIEITI